MKKIPKGLHIQSAEGKLILADAGVNVVGLRLEIKISKAAFSRKSYAEIKAFLNELEHVQGFNYATIRFDDGTGVFMVNCMTCCPEYGRVDRDGCIIGFPVAYVKDTGSCFVLADDQDRALVPGMDPKGINGIREPLNYFSYAKDNCKIPETILFQRGAVSNV